MTPGERADAAVERCTHVGHRVAACPCCITAAIRAAVEEEREACAEIAQTWRPMGMGGGCLTPTEAIAAFIRGRG